MGQVAGCCGCGTEPSRFIKCGKFFGYLKICLLPREISAPWIYLVSLILPSVDRGRYLNLKVWLMKVHEYYLNQKLIYKKGIVWKIKRGFCSRH